jgi:hypothetical protein
VGADFVARIEDMLALYSEAARARDGTRPLVGFDEQPVTPRASAHPGQPCAPGRPARVDHEYVRQGTACCPVAFAPPDGWRHVVVAAHRANADFAQAMRHLGRRLPSGRDVHQRGARQLPRSPWRATRPLFVNSPTAEERTNIVCNEAPSQTRSKLTPVWGRPRAV